MPDPKQEIVQSLDVLEKTYQSLRKAARSQAQLLTLNGAKCTEIRQYNLLMMATYNAQAGWMELLRNRGVAGVPASPPFPTLFAMQGVSGQQALDIDCAQLPTFVGPQQIRIITSDRQLWDPNVSYEVPLFDRFGADAGLGAIFLPILIASVVIVVGGMYLTSDLSADARARQISSDELKKKQAVAEVLQKDGERRAEAMKRCMNRIADPSDPDLIAACANSVDKALPKVPKNFTEDGQPIFGWSWTGKLGLIAAGIAVVVGGAAIYKRVKAKRSGGDIPLPPPRGEATLKREVRPKRGWRERLFSEEAE
jgi:hypothetical protein